MILAKKLMILNKKIQGYPILVETKKTQVKSLII